MQLPEDEAQHLARVLRLTVGDTVAVFDGQGTRGDRARGVDRSRGVSPCSMLEPRQPAPEPAVAVTLAQALLKSDKMDRVIRDAVMLGVVGDPAVCEPRTDVPRAALKTAAASERWDRTVISSVKQCGRAVVPPVLDDAGL